jgi:hypothetical protein
MKITIAAFLMICGLTFSVAAQYVYGDPATKKYFGMDCAEVGKIPVDKVRGFKSPATAEQAGFARADTCSKPVPPPPLPSDIFKTAKPKKVELPAHVSLMYLTNHVSELFGATVKLHVTIKQTNGYQGGYSRWLNKYAPFRISDDTQTGYVFMRESDAANKLIDAISLARNGELDGTATFQIRQEFFDISWPWEKPNYMYDDVMGELLSFSW